MRLIEFQNVNFSYNGETALKDFSFSVEKGDYVGIIGPNGGGKTTLVKIMLGLLKPDSGSIKLFSQDIKSFRDWPKFGYVPQRIAQFESSFPITVQEVVNLGRIPKRGIFKRASEKDFSAIEKAIDIAQISHLRKRLIADLSGGERQKVFIARALAGEPEVIILDEPAVGIDELSQEKFYKFINHLNKNLKITILFISHDIDVLAHEASTLLCVNRELVCHEEPKALFREDIIKKLYGKEARFIAHKH